MVSAKCREVLRLRLLLVAVLVWTLAGAVGRAQGMAAQSAAGGKARPELFVASGATTGKTRGATAFSPNGKWYVSGDGGTWQIWSTVLDTELRRWSPLPAVIVSNLAVAADAKTILSLGTPVMTRPEFHADGTMVGSTMKTAVALVDAVSGRLARSVDVDDAPVSLAASPTEMVFAELNADGNGVSVRAIADGKVVFAAKAKDKAPANPTIASRVFFSADGALLFVLNAEGVAAWDWHGGRKVLDFDARAAHAANLDRAVPVNYAGKPVSTARAEHYDELVGGDLSRDGRGLVVCSRDELTFFDIEARTAKIVKRPAIAAEGDRLFSECGYFPQGRYFVNTYSARTSLEMKTVLVNVKSGERVESEVVVDAVAIVPKSDRSLVRVGEQTVLLSEAGGRDAPYPPIAAFHPSFTKGGERLFWRNGQEFPLAWNLRSGEAGPVKAMTVSGYALAPSGDGGRMAYEERAGVGGSVAVFESGQNGREGRVVGRFPDAGLSTMFEPVLNGDGTVLAMLSSDTEAAVYRVGEKRRVFSLQLQAGESRDLQMALNPAGTLLAMARADGVKVYRLGDGAKVAEFAFPANPVASFGSYVQFSPDGAWLGIAHQPEPLRLVATKNWKDERRLAPVQYGPFAFSPDGRRIAYPEAARMETDEKVISFVVSGGGLVVDEVATGRRIYAVPSARVGLYCWPAFSPDGRLLAVNTETGMELLEAGSGKLLATLWVFGGAPYYDWLVATPDGRFDGSPGAWRRASWRFHDDTLDVAPLEIFFKEFYRAGLLADVVAGTDEGGTVDVAGIDRRQPVVEMSVDEKEETVAVDHVHLRLAVAESREKAEVGTGGSGARDVRLFRNGVLVKVWRGEVALDARGVGHVETDVPIAEGENGFTAYAFNEAGIKSVDATASVTGAESLHRKGTAYVVAIGVNRYAEQAKLGPIDLQFAVPDARDFESSFAASLARVGEFERPVTVSLFDEDATKGNILAALRVLGGGGTGGLTEAQKTLLAGLGKARPEDGVFLFFGGHGLPGGKHYYLAPHDFDRTGKSPEAAHAISDDELGRALEPITPGRFFLVIDACDSGQAVETNTTIGPVNGSGLAQLAYEKGLDILAAAQASEKAYEEATLGGGHGYLTYALVDEGLKTPAAATGGQVELLPWFEYAKWRVPDLQSARLREDASAAGRGGTRAGDDEAPQHPRVFYRREPEHDAFVVAMPGGR
jgi:hypothetical protein